MSEQQTDNPWVHVHVIRDDKGNLLIALNGLSKKVTKEKVNARVWDIEFKKLFPDADWGAT